MSNTENPTTTGLEIAIVGMACRFPGARNTDELWRNLAGGVESITHYTAEELAALGENPAVLAHPGYVKAARTIEDVDLFDAGFFGSSPREAEALDPQQRLFLECAWQAMEDAGYDSEAYGGLVGVFAGSKLSNYLMNVYMNAALLRTLGEVQAQTSNDKDYVATRVSYKLGLGGPSINVQTACSTSLVATHLACQSLLAGECDMALAGGVSIKVPQSGYVYQEGDLYSKDGRIRAFDAGATGTIFGNGLGLVVLKRLEDALADGDNVRALIKGSAVNNDAALKVGYTAPGADGQARVIRAAQTVAEVDPESISYIEAHGTGTPTGDPIEVSALTRVFRESTPEKSFCALGSVKTNLGHLGAAAGVAGLIKTTLALEHRQIPPSLLFEKPNPQIDFDDSPFFVNTELTEWKADGTPRRAGLSAFGIGGTNAHAVLEEAPPPAPTSPPRPHQLLLLSARSEAALDAATERLAAHLTAHPELELADVAFTLQTGRRAFEHRRALVCSDREDALAVLAGGDPKRLRSLAAGSETRRVAFMFSGQGAQYPGMGRGLYDGEPDFRRQVDRCAELLDPHLGLDLRRLLFPTGDDAEAAAELAETRNTQPALFVVEYATAQLWMTCGVTPEAMIGHSIGEYAAACLAGVMTLEEALALVAARGRLMQSLPSGSMLSVPLAEADVLPALEGFADLSIAALNAPGRSVVSGPEDSIAALAEQLAERGVRARRLHTSHAFHSGMMEPILAPFLDEVRRVDLQPPRIPYVSNLTGTWIRDEEATDPGYWAKHLRCAVRFADGVGELLAEPGRVLLEVGPGNTLAGLAKRHPQRRPQQPALASIRHPKSKQSDDRAQFSDILSELWLAGVDIDWQGFYGDERRRRVPLPTYPFERRRYWVEPSGEATATAAAAAAVAPRGVATPRKDLADWFYLPCWKPSVTPAPLPEDGDDGPWLVFSDGEGLGERLAERLRRLGREVVTVAAGDTFEQRGEGVYALAPGHREDYSALLAALPAAPRRVVHLWGVTAAGQADLESAQERGFYSLLFLAQALAGGGGSGDVHLAVVTSGAQCLGGESPETLEPAKATVLGPCQVLAREAPRLKTVAVDVTLPADGELVEALLAEAADPKAGELAAYRGGQRWRRGLEPSPVDRALPERLPTRDGGAYLITGGLGGFGLTFADELARRHGARLVLLGRTPLPPRESWDEHLEDGAEARTARRIRRVRELEELGAEVMLASADVTDEAQLRGVVDEACRRFGAIDGVIHAAGLPGGGLLQLKTREMAERVLAPKVRGTIALAAALETLPTPPDFLVLCSSTIAVLGTFGQVDYCAANCFLDAWAEARTAAGQGGVVSIGWGAWQEVGMAVETPPPIALGTSATEESGGETATEPAAAEPPSEPLHPLIDRRLEDGSEAAAFATAFSPERHWVLDEHRILGNPAIPGTTYLELARAAFALHTGGGDAAELEDVFFFQPLMVAAGESKEARVELTPQDGGFRFRITSRAAAGAARTDHARGRVGPAGPGEPGRFDLGEIRGRCAEKRDFQASFDDEDKLVYWGPRWQSLKSVHLGESEALARLELPEEFAGDLGELGLHPALLDVATALTSGLTEGESYLPLSYHKVRIHGRLPRACHSYLRLQGAPDGETVSADVALLDDDGRELVAIERFTMKRVGEARARLAEGAAAAPPAKVPMAVPPAAAGQGLFATDGMLPAEGVEALRRVLSRVRRPRVVVSPRDLAGLGRLTAPAAMPSAAPESSHPRPELSTPYAAPAGEIESRLAEIWQGVLGVDRVGVHDNFFDLGGDSVMGITVISQAAEAGLELAPEHLFEHQTIAELAELLGGAPTGAATPAEEAAPADGAGPDFADSGLAPDELDKVLAKLEDIT